MLDGYLHNYGLKPSRCKRLPVRGSRACADVPMCRCAEVARPREGQMSICFRRREFIAGLGGAATATGSAQPCRCSLRKGAGPGQWLRTPFAFGGQA
jgi:hypothetical protein